MRLDKFGTIEYNVEKIADGYYFLTMDTLVKRSRTTITVTGQTKMIADLVKRIDEHNCRLEEGFSEEDG